MTELRTPDALRAWYERDDDALKNDAAWPAAHAALLDALESGEVRAASQ